MHSHVKSPEPERRTLEHYLEVRFLRGTWGKRNTGVIGIADGVEARERALLLLQVYG